MKPWLLLPAKWAHDLGPRLLPVFSLLLSSKDSQYQAMTWRGLNFRNPMGLAGGADKNALNCRDWQALGAGFLEVGTVTPEPQTPNPGEILKRSYQQKAVWNKMGFPNAGAVKTLAQLTSKRKSIHVPVFVNAGKNRWTDNSLAHTDYISVIDQFKSIADVFVINISSPNTKDLRSLQSADAIKGFLAPIKNHCLENKISQPLLLKVSPDMDKASLSHVLLKSLELDFDGWILTNTTQDRSKVTGFPIEGGISGKPLTKKSLEILKWAVEILGDKKQDRLLISAGGVMSHTDIIERRHAGADLVQVYSALIFEGPLFFKKSLKALRSSKV